MRVLNTTHTFSKSMRIMQRRRDGVYVVMVSVVWCQWYGVSGMVSAVLYLYQHFCILSHLFILLVGFLLL